MKLGIVGLPNVGKSTLFNAMTSGKAESANYPFCTIDPNIGIVAVPDSRLSVLTDLYQSEKTIPAVIEFVDIAGLVKGASKGEGLGNQFLSNIREVDAIVHVVRCFSDENVVHVEGSVDPVRDIETIQLELVFSDLDFIDRRYQKTQKAAKADKSLQKELALLERVKNCLESGQPVRHMDIDDEEEKELINSMNLLTFKPVLYAANVLEDDLRDDGANNPYVKAVRDLAEKESAQVFVLCAKIEEEMAELDEEEKKIFLEDLGVTHSGLDKLIDSSYTLLGLISFLTAGPKETRAWTITKGTKAPQAAGKIHTDFERGFIRAEIVHYDDLVAQGTFNAAKEKGLVRSEGKEYVMKDGDVVLFRFNV